MRLISEGSFFTGQYAAEEAEVCACSVIVWCRAIIAEAMDGELEFQFIHAWFNVVFLASAFLTIVFLYSQQRRDRDADLPVYVPRRD